MKGSFSIWKKVRKKRTIVHSKNNHSNSKGSKNYVKKYRGPMEGSSKVNEADKQLLGILKSTNRNRRIITVIVLVTFMLIMVGIGVALFSEAE